MLSRLELEAIFHAGRPVEYDPGTFVFQQGEGGEHMYVLERGAVEVIFDEDREAKRLGPGDFFGELAAISDKHRRSASVRTLQPTRLCILDRTAFERLAQQQPRVFFTLISQTVGYLLSSEQELVEKLRRRNAELAQTLDYLRRTREELDYQELLAQTDGLTGLYPNPP